MSGVLAVVVLVVVAFSAISPSQTASVRNNSVLGLFTLSTSKFSAPQGLTATTTDSHVTLSWKSVPKAAFYYIYRSSSWIGGMTKIASTKYTNYTDNTTVPSTRYRYAVSAFNGFSESGRSSAKSITASARIMPVKPTIVGYDSGSSSLFASVVWNYQEYATGYYLYCDNCINKKMIVSSAELYTDKEFGDLMHKEFDVVAGTDYVAYVSAYRTINGKTTESEKSTAITFKGGVAKYVWPPSMPTGLKYNGTSNDNTIASFLWDKSVPPYDRPDTLTGYYLYCNGCATKRISVSKDSIIGSTYGPQMYGEFDVLAGRNYSIQVSAYGTIDSIIYESAKSVPLSFNSTTTKVTGPPVLPLNFQIMNLTATTIVFQFKSRHNAGGGDYLHCEQCAVQKMEINSTNFTQAVGSDGSAPDGTETWVLSGLTPGKPYRLALSSYNDYGGVKMESLLTKYNDVGTLPY